RCAPPRPCQPDRSGPLPADTSAAARAATSCTGMWSTVTAILFFCPQSFAKLSNHLSYSGTKWLHCTIDSDLLSANPRDTNGAESIGARPAAPADALRKFRRVKERVWLFPPDSIAHLPVGSGY